METASEQTGLQKEVSAPKKNGGARPGSGRPRSEVRPKIIGKKEIFWDRLSDEKYIAIIDALLERAKENPVDAHYVINQVIGKPFQRIELSGDIGHSLNITFTVPLQHGHLGTRQLSAETNGGGSPGI